MDRPMIIKTVLRFVGFPFVMLLASSCTSQPVPLQHQIVSDPMRYDQLHYPDRDSLAQEKEAKEQARKQDMLKK